MDRHEYEINQLINPKKDIVKSNSKHRDKIETLIQGRRVEGINRGGDTPEKTLWKKILFSEGNSIYCETQGKDTLILPKNSEGSMPIVLNGVVVDFSRYPDEAINSLIVGPLNAKGYNLPSSGWNEEIVSLKRGDAVPNWDQYIEI